ncbi:hypothetical protein LOK49_LG06G01750 [Camellia lanceoleosa]|uniref:Uncharacterized protein n=1 Tax=Camellia lanceoleosa TaxID=1840588 RepID=A0ACC0HCP2_9ERIC|nr:hypothetical protein LOK49_LG06G01750 [Camellia lanceoleosa]
MWCNSVILVCSILHYCVASLGCSPGEGLGHYLWAMAWYQFWKLRFWKSVDHVSQVVVYGAKLCGATYGVRIKSWSEACYAVGLGVKLVMCANQGPWPD